VKRGISGFASASPRNHSVLRNDTLFNAFVLVSKEKIDAEVIEKLDLIVSVAEKARRKINYEEGAPSLL